MKKIIKELQNKLKKDVQSWDYRNGINDYYSVLFDYAEKNDQLIKELIEALVFATNLNCNVCKMCYEVKKECSSECTYVKYKQLIERAKEMVK